MSKLNVLNLGGMSILKALHLEEALLRCSKENWFIFNHGHKQRNIVVGFSGKVIELVHTKEAHKQNIQTIRRYTGGGTVITDENTMFTTFIMNVRLIILNNKTTLYILYLMLHLILLSRRMKQNADHILVKS